MPILTDLSQQRSTGGTFTIEKWLQAVKDGGFKASCGLLAKSDNCLILLFFHLSLPLARTPFFVLLPKQLFLLRCNCPRLFHTNQQVCHI